VIVRIRRPAHARRSRLLLAIAVLLPAAGFFQAAGVNPLTTTAAIVLVAAAALIVADACRAVLVMTRHGLIIRQLFGSGSRELLWADVDRAEVHGPVIELQSRRFESGRPRATRHAPAQARSVFQLDLGKRAASAVARCHQRNLISGTG
jgi:hypothetical protein